jgi:hypothetical protein
MLHSWVAHVKYIVEDLDGLVWKLVVMHCNTPMSTTDLFNKFWEAIYSRQQTEDINDNVICNKWG